MPDFHYLVKVTTDTEEHADTVIYSRLGYDEEIDSADGDPIEYHIDFQMAYITKSGKVLTDEDIERFAEEEQDAC